jgi:two-component system, LytTR family, sensor kinase
MSRPQKVLLWFLLWTAVGLFFSTQLILIDRYLYQRKVSWADSVIGVLPKWYLWFLLTPVMLWMSRRFPIDRGRWVPRTALHLLASAILGLLVVAGYAFIAHYGNWDLGGPRGYQGKFLFFLSINYHWDMLTYGLVVAISQAAAYYRDLQERDARLAQAQLQALKSQLHPHFLFNALHATMVLVRKDPPAAEKMIVRLGELLRATLDNSGRVEVPLRQEIHFIEQYLDIERTRFADRLTVEWNIDAQALELLVPNMILQPLVENAVRHGISPRATPGLIQVRATLQNGRLKLEVQDNGVGSSSDSVKEGIGLSNTRARLKQLYGERQKFELAAPSTGGFTVRMELPVLVAT